MILVLNCFVEEKYVDEFNEAISRILDDLDCEYDIRKIGEIADADTIDLQNYTHLIISGSEASVLDDNSWDEVLANIILHFVTSQKRVLGICYGHQFLARTLAGKECLKKRARPEIGWVRISTEENMLFKNKLSDANQIVSLVIHYDEVIRLPQDFKVIASSAFCPIHAFQYKNLPVWGIQFHPEYDKDQSIKTFETFSKSEPHFDECFVNDLQNDSELDNNFIFRNFIYA